MDTSRYRLVRSTSLPHLHVHIVGDSTLSLTSLAAALNIPLIDVSSDFVHQLLTLLPADTLGRRASFSILLLLTLSTSYNSLTANH